MERAVLGIEADSADGSALDLRSSLPFSVGTARTGAYKPSHATHSTFGLLRLLPYDFNTPMGVSRAAPVLRSIFSPARTLPVMPWSSTRPGALRQRVPTLAVLTVGLWLFGTGEAGLVNAKLGNTPWTVLAQGLAGHTSLTIGEATIAVSVVVLLGWIPLRQRPGVGTVANVIVIGVAIDVMTRGLPHPHALVGRSLEAGAAIVTVGIGGALYLTAHIGPGPRDGWMTGIHRRFGWPLARVRAAIELTALGAGYALGGTVGVATVAFALLVGYCLTITLKLFTTLRPS